MFCRIRSLQESGTFSGVPSKDSQRGPREVQHIPSSSRPNRTGNDCWSSSWFVIVTNFYSSLSCQHWVNFLQTNWQGWRLHCNPMIPLKVHMYYYAVVLSRLLGGFWRTRALGWSFCIACLVTQWNLCYVGPTVILLVGTCVGSDPAYYSKLS